MIAVDRHRIENCILNANCFLQTFKGEDQQSACYSVSYLPKRSPLPRTLQSNRKASQPSLLSITLGQMKGHLSVVCRLSSLPGLSSPTLFILLFISELLYIFKDTAHKAIVGRSHGTSTQHKRQSRLPDSYIRLVSFRSFCISASLHLHLWFSLSC